MSHDHLNKQIEVEVEPDVFEKWRRDFEGLERDMRENGEVVWMIVDGFVLYWDPVRIIPDYRFLLRLKRENPSLIATQEVVDLLDVRVFLRVPHDILKHRRKERQVYVLQSKSPAHEASDERSR